MSESEEHKIFARNVFSRYYSVSERSFSALWSIANIQYLDKGELLLRIGEAAKNIYILYQGSIVSYYISSEGYTYHKNIFFKGDFVGSKVSLLSNAPSNFALEAIEESAVFSFDYCKYRQLIGEHKDLQSFYIAYLEKNWVIDKEKREIDIVLKDAKRRYSDFINLHPNIENRIPLHYIASHLGITPTQLSRIRKKEK